MTFGQIIKKLRRDADMTQERLAEVLSVSAQAVSRWETDTGMPDVSLLPPLANLFGVTTNPVDQPYMCRDFEKEYGVKSFWELPKEVIAERETHFVAEMTPMMVAELIQLSSLHKVIICEGDIDYCAIAPVATNMVHLCNQSTSFDWFDRPDHENIRDTVARRTDLSDEEKQRVIEKAYECVTPAELSAPDWVTELGIKNIIWNDHTSIDTTAAEVAEYFGFAE